jgi:hypothetical protein
MCATKERGMKRSDGLIFHFQSCLMPKYFRFSEDEKLGATRKIKENQKPNAQLLHETTAVSLQRYTCPAGHTRNVYILAIQNTLKRT